jgi:hypothetical protein
MQWECVSLPSAGEDIIAHLLRKLRDNEQIIDRFSPKVLLMEIEKHSLWRQDRDFIPIRELWDDYTRYLYLQRLSGFNVLEEAIQVGVKNGDFFAYAEGIDDNGFYQGLCLGEKGYAHVTPDGYLIKLDAAKRQITQEEQKKTVEQIDRTGGSGQLFPEGNGNEPVQDNPITQPAINHNTHFYAGIDVDPNKLGTTAGQIKNEILQHFTQLPGVNISVSLDIQVSIPEGTPSDIVRIVNENCNTLGIKGAEFRDD